MKIAILGLALMAADMTAAPAWAENPTKIRYSCAPWDGQSLVIEVGAPDIVYELNVWGAGFTALRKGERKILHLKDSASSQGDGVAKLCGASIVASDGSACRMEKLDVRFDHLEWQVGGTIAGEIEFNTMKVPFEGILQDDDQPCGG